MDQEINKITEVESVRENILREISELPDEIKSPEVLRGDDLVFFHEGGHATVALLLNVQIDAYNVAGRLGWVSVNVPKNKRHYGSVKLDSNEGVVSYKPSVLSEEDRKMMSVGGVASELSHFGHIASSALDQDGDRKKGGFSSIFEIQKEADPLADRFDTDLKKIYVFTLRRIGSNKGFDDVNLLIENGVKISELFGIEKNVNSME